MKTAMSGLLFVVFTAAAAAMGGQGGQVTVPVPEDVSAPPATAEKTPSGLASRVLKNGTGTKHPTSTSSVTVH